MIPTAAIAQDLRSSVSGRVTDPTGLPIVGAKVVATNTGTNVATSTATNSVGTYTIVFLPPGRYTLSIQTSGFKTFTQTNLILNASGRAVIDVQLQVGQVIENVSVTAEVPALETETPIRGSLVTNQQIIDLPTNGSNLYLLVHMMPGVQRASTSYGSTNSSALSMSTSISINGGIRQENETLLDGVTNTMTFVNVAFQPPIESIAEMKVQTSNFDAAYGRFGGGVVAMVTKSGTNSFHGSLFEFNRVSALASNSFSGQWLKGPKSWMENNRFGFEADGPIYIPKLLDGRNKLFLMVSFDGFRNPTASAASGIVPTVAMRSGDFSGIPQIMYDPLSTRQVGNQFVRDPFAANQIPANRINVVSKNVLQYVPLPNLATTNLAAPNYVNRTTSTMSYNEIFSKFDYAINDKNRISVGYGRLPEAAVSGILFGRDNPADPTTSNPLENNFWRYMFDWTSSLNARTVLNFRFGMTRFVHPIGNTASMGFDPRKLGFADDIVSQFTKLHFPEFVIGGNYTNYGDYAPGTNTTRECYSYQLNLNRTQGHHQLKFGTEFRNYNELFTALSSGVTNARLPSGNYMFSKQFTQANAAIGDATSGDEFASFLLGYPSGGSVVKDIDPAWNMHYYAAFFQDDYRIHRRVTLNLGLRYDYEQPYRERYNRMSRGFAYDQASPIAAQVRNAAGVANCPACANLTGGLLFAGSSGINQRLYDPDKNNIQPRVGIAVLLSPSTVLRGGYGLFYMNAWQTGDSPGFSAVTPLQASSDGGNTPRVNLVNAFPEGLMTPMGSTRGMATNLGQDITFYYLKRVVPYSQQLSFSLQRSLPFGLVAEAAYSGNFSRRYEVGVNLDAIPAQYLGQPTTYYRQLVTNPMAGLLPANPTLNGATIPLQQLLLPFPQYTSVGMNILPLGKSDYHAMQGRVSKRLSHGMALNLGYTISKTLAQLSFKNSQDFKLNDMDSSALDKEFPYYDVPQKFTALLTYELPFGKGRPFLNGARGVLGKIVSGWQVNTIVTVQSGFPLQFPNAPPIEARSAKLSSSQISLYNAFDKSLFPRTAPNLQYSLRTWPAYFPDARSYPLKNVDLAFGKKTAITERLAFEFRAEAYNVANHPWYSTLASGGADVTNVAFGRYPNYAGNDARQIMLVGKLIW